MRYRVEISKHADKVLGRLPKTIRERILRALIGLETDPRPPGCAKLRGFDNTYRLRAGDYRVVYEIHDQVLVVLVVRLGHRREVYRV